MRRWFPIAAYGLGGFALAAAMVWGGFAVAGHRLSTPANPIQPLASAPASGSPATYDASSGPSQHDEPSSPSPTAGVAPPLSPVQRTFSPSGEPHSDDHSGGGGDD